MTPSLARALLDWFHANDVSAPITAHHVIQWSGAAALSACVTANDFETVGRAMARSVELVQQMTLFNFNARAPGVTPAMIVSPPDGYEVQFNTNRVLLLLNGELLADATLTEDK